MSVEFNEPGLGGGSYPNPNFNQQGGSGMVRLVIKWGMAKDEAGANKVLLGIAVTCFLISAFVLISTF